MALVNTINFLPHVFQTPTNQRFLGATLDQLATDAVNTPVNGYIGKTFTPTYKLGDNYVPAASAQRQHYQLEPSVVVTDPESNIIFNAGYIDLLNSIQYNGGLTQNHNRLFSAESYNYDGKFDYDKFVNYYDYYWLPDGPAPIQLFANQVPYEATYSVTRNTATNGYNFTGKGPRPNTQVTLARGGTYTFNINQPGIKFWIQTQPGLSGQDANISTVSTRQVFGVTNNGTDVGSITLRVPTNTAQNFFTDMPIQATVTAAISLHYTDIQNKLLSEFLAEFPDGIDGINTQLLGRQIIFINNDQDDTYWTTPSVTPTYASLDKSSLLPGTIVASSDRTNTWIINLVATGTGDYIIQLASNVTVSPLQKIFISSGKTYAANQFWLDTSNRYQPVPVLTAELDYLYYQDSENPDYFGEIKLVNNKTSTIDVTADIIGKKQYTSPNGIVFTNGLKIALDEFVTPAEYAPDPATPYVNKEFYVEGVGTSINLIPVTELAVPDVTNIETTVVNSSGVVTTRTADISLDPDYVTINRSSIDRNLWSRYNRWFHKDIINTVAEYYGVAADYGPGILARRPIIEFEPNLQLYQHGKQAKLPITAIWGINTGDYVTDAFNEIEGFYKPATSIVAGRSYTIRTSLGYGATTNFTLVGASSNLPGTVFIATGTPTGTGTVSLNVDGVTLEAGDRIVFANDFDTAVRNKIYEVVIETITSANYLRLVETTDDPILPGENVLVLTGTTYKNQTYTFNVDTSGNPTWTVCQPKETINQAPLFDLVDNNGYSFSNPTVYPNSTFAGTKFFSYQLGTGTVDPVLGFPLTYRNFDNIGDIVFANSYETDTFKYIANQKTVDVKCNSGYLNKNIDFSTAINVNSWVKTAEDTKQDQIFTKLFDGYVITVDGVEKAYVQIDVLPTANTTIPHTKVYLNNKLLVNGLDYNITSVGVYYAVVLEVMPTVGDKIDVAILSDSPSSIGYYEIPPNLDLNPLNETFPSITLGQLRTHYNKLIETTSISLTGVIPLQDNYLKSQQGTLVQHSSPLTYAMIFLNDPTVNFVDGVSLARKEYTKFKNKFLLLCSTLTNLDYNDPVSGVDTILQNINLVKNSNFPWYYSDMVPQGNNYSLITYKVINSRQTKYELSTIFNNTALSNRAVIIYVNGDQQTLGVDYTFSNISPAVIFSRSFVVGDVITIREYSNTDGNYIPETPTKLGLHPKVVPQIYLDSTFRTPTLMLQGHDGSLTPAFGDFRDDFLLELEKRIYNNIKADYNKNEINLWDIVPGRFRTTAYSLDEFTQILSQGFSGWVGQNNLDYTVNTEYNVNDSWTWNYGNFTDAIDGSLLQGSWRAIYNYWFDTLSPNLTPWQMLGFNGKPTWWESRYGSAPYTGNNTLLWEDLEAGYIWNNGDSYTDSRFARPGLTKFIPVDAVGNLRSPTEIPLINKYNLNPGIENFSVGQFSPAEAAWRRSSDYAFSLQLALALCVPAKYFSTQIDTSGFTRNNNIDQYLTDTNQKINPMVLKINGDNSTGTIQRTSGYINWIGDSIKHVGIDPVSTLTEYFTNLAVKLNYKVGGYTDKNLITVFAEQTSPGSTNSSVILPDSNYKIYLNKSVPVTSAVYSAVVVEKTIKGYAVSGYDVTHPFFTIIPSIANNNSQEISLNGTTIKIYQDNTKTLSVVPYGTEFATIQQVADFLISYERQLINSGFTFTQFDQDLNTTRNWTLSVQELVYWSQQGWQPGTIIVLNPTATQLTLQSLNSVVDEISNSLTGSKLLDQNFLPIRNTNFDILRTDSPTTTNNFLVRTLNGATICYARLNLVQFEHTLVFDNVSDFGDILYIPSQGTRQNRLKLAGTKTGGWVGSLSAPGYIYNNPQFNAWQSGTDYQLGDIVTYNNFQYTASQDIPASSTFDNTKWKLNAGDIKTGLLPSFGRQAQYFENIYDIDRPADNEQLQEYSAGLIGFRQRQFLTDLGISIPTQTKFYQGYIKEKGSLNSINALTKANFNNVNGNLTVYEEWAFKVGEYGGLDSNAYKEFVLDQSIFTSDPVAFTLFSSNSSYTTANAVIGLTLSNVYNSSNLSSTSTSLYSNRSTDRHMHDLPDVGYVCLDDVSYTIFDITKVDTVTEDISGLTARQTTWIAKDNNRTWNVLRAFETNLTATTLTYVLDSYAQLTFNTTHSFSVGDMFALQAFGALYNGIYTITDVPSSTKVTISISDTVVGTNVNSISPLQTLSRQSFVTGLGTVYAMKSARVTTIAARDALSTPLNGWKNGDLVWVDNNGTNNWAVYSYSTATSAWVLFRQQQPHVDINSISRTFIYNKSNNNILAALDYINPAKGKVLNAIEQDIDYMRVSDPAKYNQGTGTLNPDLCWGADKAENTWWNLDTVRYVNYEQDSTIYRLNHWGQTFPGSSFDVYEWIESPVLPSQFVIKVGKGVPLYEDDSAYTTVGYVTNTGTVNVKYYFWVTNRDIVARGKTNSTISLANGLEDPAGQGIPYAAILRNDTVALYNVNSVLTGQNSIVQLGQQLPQTNLVHSEYALIQEGNPHSQLPTQILNKLVDSLSGMVVTDHYELVTGVNTLVTGTLPVPDSTLLPNQRYGTKTRPRQTLVMNRALALANYFDVVNKKLLEYPIVQRKVLTTLNSSQEIPNVNSLQYSLTVTTFDELSYINTDLLTAGYRVLVLEDSNYQSKWAIYQLNVSKQFVVDTNYIQSYKTNLYWTYANWYDSSFNPSTTIDVTVDTPLELGKITLTPLTYVKVTNTGNGTFAIYYVDSALNLTLVAIENGTIQISSGKPGSTVESGLFVPGVNYTIASLGSTDFTLIGASSNTVGTDFIATGAGTGTGTATGVIDIPGRELRQILLAMQNEIFIDDLSMDYNEIFFIMIKYILTEQKNIDWVFKTSFISASQNIRKLEQFPSYVPDDQNFYLDYINEVKPYRTVVREFVIDYQRNDKFGGDITDFDLPSYWDQTLRTYRSPTGEQSYDAALLNSSLYVNWKNNYKYQIVDFIVDSPGTGFISPPQVIITGGGGTGANAIASIYGNGTLANISVVSSGVNYTSSPLITINGTGTGAKATAVLRNVYDGNSSGHNVIRSIKTNIKFDRVTYTSSNVFQNWDNVTASQVIAANTVILLGNALYRLSNVPYTVTANIDFPIANTTQMSASQFNTANDRIAAFHGNVDFSLVADGIVYPGVTIDGNTYVAWAANLIVPSESLITYQNKVYITSGNVYDTGGTFANVSANVDLANYNSMTQIGNVADNIIASDYTDAALGIRATDINVDGGAYIDTYSSHAPQELIPGRSSDILDMKVFWLGFASPGVLNSDVYGFRNFYSNLTQSYNWHRITNSATTTLAQDLLISDTTVHVTDASILPPGNPAAAVPGAVFINGEKITYYKNYSYQTPWTANISVPTDTVITYSGNIYITTGNVYGAYFANVNSNVSLVGTVTDYSNSLGQIRRAVDGTTPNNLNIHNWSSNIVLPVGSYLNYSGNTYLTTGNIYAWNTQWRANLALPVGSYFTQTGNVYQSTGNVYGLYFSNVVANTTRIRSGTDAVFNTISSNISLLFTGTNGLRHLAGQRVVDVSEQQRVLGADTYQSNIGLTANTFTATANVSYRLRLNNTITANVGDYINQTFANATVAANVRVLGNVTNSANIAVVGVTGAFISNVLLANLVTLNGSATSANVLSANVLGTINANGTVVLTSSSHFDQHKYMVTQGNIFYGNATNHYLDGNGLYFSSTAQATFLKAERGYTP